MVVNIIIIALVVFVAIKERKTFKLALSYDEDEQDE
jgi:large-conductance mechanosensitive channel